MNIAEDTGKCDSVKLCNFCMCQEDISFFVEE